MFDFLNQHIAVVSSVISMVILVATYFAFKFKIDFWWLNFWYSLPVIGKLATLSKDTTRFAKDKGWTNAERKLCEDYKQFIHFTSDHEFRKRLAYLAKAHDLGRTPLPGWLVFVLGALVIAEGLGFSYLLGTWMAMEGSENTRLILMVAIVLVLCVILLFVTHAAGHQLYRTNLIRGCEKEWRDAGQPGNFKTQTIKLNDDQETDDAHPEYTQCVNRVGTSGSYVMLGVAIVAIVFIAVTSTLMRVKHLENEQTQETAQTAVAPTTGNPFASSGSLPPDLAAPQQEADKKAAQEGKQAFRDEGLAAFSMLAFIFIVTQIVGIAAGYKWGFAGKESKAAFRGTRGFSTYDDLLAYYEPIIQTARSKLQSMQQRLSERRGNQGLGLDKSFDDYLIEQARQSDQLRQHTISGKAPAPTIRDAATLSVEEAMAAIDAKEGDKEAAKQYLLSLDPTIKQQVMEILKERKARKDEEQRRKEQESKELDELF